MALPIFVFPPLVVIDYLDKTYFYNKSPPWSLSLWALFSDLKGLNAYQPLSSEDLEECKEEDKELFDFLKSLNQENLEQQKAYENDSRPVFLFLKAKSDYNGALNNADNAITINDDNNKSIQELKLKYKIVLIDNITHIDDIKQGLEKITNTIQHVWILAHGTPTSMLLDGNNKIENTNIDALSDLMQQKLSKDAHVVLYSCSTGRSIFSEKNMATKFSEILPGRTIWAPKVPTGVVTVDLREAFSTKVSFWKSKSRLKFLQEKAWNICCLRPFKKIEIECNVTTQIKDGIVCS